ncbi:cytochrome C [Luteimonas aestuarii]|uniref:Cytochrome C n=1 Tax=Luteimonas aestuarii TaxID=453837 RepID=A0A4R5U1I8_9GAMM|nr:cytochrome C [Luteimonas aestuarii]TDK27465.1 cytochrome C [Luteimonas aestuarii]
MRLPIALAAACMLSACQPPSTSGPPLESAPATVAPASGTDAGLIAHGEYIVRIGGCNDCHTADYMPRGGDVPKDAWLTGSPLGYHGPWGTTYATNLRLTVDGLSETEWLDYTGKLHTRPIMPDFVLRQMREADRRAIYHFIRSLGRAGEPSRPALPPGETPPPPYFQLVEPVAATE